MTNQEIKNVGQTIAQETQIGGNTAARVGGVVEGIGVALDNKDAANGYYQATINGGTITVNAPNYLLGTGGNLRIKMPSAGTTASTLTIGNANAVQLWYNGAAVSSQNTWEQDEIISVFYDGTRFMASNAQGGGGKAKKIKYDNSQSGLAAENVQEALDEIKGSIGDVDYNETVIPLTVTAKSRYIINNGVVETADSDYCKRAEPIDVSSYDKISAAFYLKDAYTSVSVFTDDNGNVVGNKILNDGQGYVSFNIPDGATKLYLCTRKNESTGVYDPFGAKITEGISVMGRIDKIDDYLYGDLRTLAIGQNYYEGEGVQTDGKELLRVTKEIKSMSITDEVSNGGLRTYSGNTFKFKSLKDVKAYTINRDSVYAEGDYAIGSPAGVTVGVEVDNPTEGKINVTFAGVIMKVDVTSGSDAASVAHDLSLAFGNQEKWALIDNGDGTLKLKSKYGVVNAPSVAPVVSPSDAGVSVTYVANTSYTGSTVLSQYDGSAWSEVTLANYAGDASMWEEVGYENFIKNYTEQNYVPKIYQELGNNIDGAISQKGVKKLFTYNSDELFDYTTAGTSIRRTTSGYAVDYIKIERINLGFKVTCIQVGAYTYASIRLPNLTVGEKYHISFDFMSAGVPSRKTMYIKITSNNTFNGTESWGTAVSRNTSAKISVTFTAASSVAWLSVANNDLGAVNAYCEFTDISLTELHVYNNVGETLASLEKSQAITEELSNEGVNIFNIDKQTVGRTSASNFDVVKTDNGFRFTCTGAVSSTYTWASITPLVIGKDYVLDFDYTSYIPGIWKKYTGLCRLSTNPSSRSPTDTKVVYLTQDNGHCTMKFNAAATTLYLRMAAADLTDNAVIELSNIRLFSYSPNDVKSLDAIGYKRVTNDVQFAKYYYGNPLPSVTKKNVLGLQKVVDSGHAFTSQESVQGCAAWKEYLFEFSSGGKVNVYNLKTGTFVQQVAPTDDTGVTESYYIHYNNVAFSTKFYDDEDDFPLLYASGETRSNTDKCYVYRITENGGVFSMSIIQKISFKYTHNGSTSSGFQQIYVDTIENRMYILNVTGGYNWYKFNIPNVKDGDTPIYEVTLTDSDIVDSFTTFVSPAFKRVNIQGGIIVNGIAYTVFGVPSRANNRTGLLAIDLWNKRTVSFVDLTSLGWYYEPEGLAFYDNHLYMNTGGFVGALYPNSGAQHSGSDNIGQGIFKLYF